MQRNWKPLGTYLISLTPGKLCLGPLPLCCKAKRPFSYAPFKPLRNLNTISWPLIGLRVNISNPLLQQQNITSWDNLVLKTNFRSSIQILPRSVFLLNPLGLLWARFPYKSLRNVNTKLGRMFLPSTLQLLLQRLLLLVTLQWRSISIV